MSSHLPFQTQEYEDAVQNVEQLVAWEKKQLIHFKKQLEKAPTLTHLLAYAELSLRQGDRESLESSLQKVFAENPHHPDAHYLKASDLIARGEQEAVIVYLNEALQKTTDQSSDTARLNSLLAQCLLRFKNDVPGAAKQLKQGIERCGNFSFFHVTTHALDTLTPAQLAFDLAVFDTTYPWEKEPVSLCFCAVSTDSNGHVYVLESKHKWLFKLDAKGQLLSGLTERQLSGQELLFPERLWKLTDVTTDSAGHIYVASCSGIVQAFDNNWQPGQQFAHPEAVARDKVLSIAVDSRGILYALYLHRRGVHAFRPDGSYIDCFGANTTMPETKDNYYCGLAIDNQDRLLLYDRCNLQIYNTETWQQDGCMEVPDSNPDDMLNEDYPLCWNGVDVDSEGYIYLVNTYQENVVVLDSDGNSLEMIDRMDQKLNVLTRPGDVAVARDRTLYIADTGQSRIVQRNGNQWSVLLAHPNWVGA